MEDTGGEEVEGSDCGTNSRWHQSNDDKKQGGITLRPARLDFLANQSCWFLASCLSLLTKCTCLWHISVHWICFVCLDESNQRVQTTCWDVKKHTIKEMKTWKQSLVTDNCHMLKDAEFQAVSLKTTICLSDEYYTIWNARLLVCYFPWLINEERNYFPV